MYRMESIHVVFNCSDYFRGERWTSSLISNPQYSITSRTDIVIKGNMLAKFSALKLLGNMIKEPKTQDKSLSVVVMGANQ